jgi:RNA polymerase sigma-70 factor (ECF subfamily)
MPTTSASLLERLRQPGDQAAWSRFVQLYTPLLYSWARQVRLQHADAADLVQEVFTLLFGKLPEFKYDTQKSFRTWLRTVLLNKWRDQRKRRAIPVQQLKEPALSQFAGPDRAEGLEEAEYHRYLLGRACELIQPKFQTGTWEAFRACVVLGKSRCTWPNAGCCTAYVKTWTDFWTGADRSG